MDIACGEYVGLYIKVHIKAGIQKDTYNIVHNIQLCTTTVSYLQST
jgi:hypothetical protein